MNEIIFHTKLVDGSYVEHGPNIIVHIHAADCPIEGCLCEPLVKRVEEISI
jgi:hypothetical protein